MKFVDDLSTLEIINLLNVGLSSFNTKLQVPSDISVDNYFIPSENLKSQSYLYQIDEWTQKQTISIPKTKAMVFNFTDNFKFSTRLKLQNENIQFVDKMKLLGTVINDRLTWDDNCQMLIKKVNARMKLIRSVLALGSSGTEIVHLGRCSVGLY